MGKQKRHLLSLDNSLDFELIGICSHHGDYRLAWGLNQKLKLSLAKCDENFIVTRKKSAIQSEHPYYFWFDEENQVEFYLIKNKNEGKYLIPEKNQIDYFLFLRENTILETEEIVEKIKTVNSVLGVYNFDPEELPSAELIVF